MAPPSASSSARFIQSDGSFTIERRGLRRRVVADLFHFLMSVPWWALLGLVVASFVMLNALFALAYYFDPTGIENAQPGSYLDAFFFSVQTMATIGYGKLVPRSIWANAVVSLEALTGMIGLSLTTGLVFAKFSRPTARLLFSREMALYPREGRPCLAFRIANERGNYIAEAQVRVVLVREEVTAEGERLRRLHDLTLLRSTNPVFSLTWLVIHPITETSPLFGETPESLARSATEIAVSLVGIDNIMSQTVHARYVYHHSDIRWNMRFTDIFRFKENGRRVLDYTRFHLLEASVPPTPENPERDDERTADRGREMRIQTEGCGSLGSGIVGVDKREPETALDAQVPTGDRGSGR